MFYNFIDIAVLPPEIYILCLQFYTTTKYRKPFRSLSRPAGQSPAQRCDIAQIFKSHFYVFTISVFL